jgi:hypothetical protein
MADEGDGRETVLLLHERVIPSELESDRLSAQLIERVGWALVDADEIERRAPSPGVSPARTRVMQHEGAKTAAETRPLRAA